MPLARSASAASLRTTSATLSFGGRGGAVAGAGSDPSDATS